MALRVLGLGGEDGAARREPAPPRGVRVPRAASATLCPAQTCAEG